MSENEMPPNIDELDQIINKLMEHTDYPAEWYFAIKSGWDNIEFDSLYSDFVKSTQAAIASSDDATTIKGKPLEKITHYFLKEGGICTNIREIGDHQRWQVDGQGPLNTASMLKCFSSYCSNFGVQLYMEAKNHINPITNSDFSLHFRRMVEHDCFFGVCISTSGYSISRGKGIAQSIHNNFLRNRYHLLLSFHALYSVAIDDKAPLAILKEVLTFAMNDLYSNDRDIQELYSPTHNNSLAKAEFRRLFN